MKTSLYPVLLIVLFTLSVQAQSFERTLGGVYNDRPNCIEHTADNGYVIAGTENPLSDT